MGLHAILLTSKGPDLDVTQYPRFVLAASRPPLRRTEILVETPQLLSSHASEFIDNRFVSKRNGIALRGYRQFGSERDEHPTFCLLIRAEK